MGNAQFREPKPGDEVISTIVFLYIGVVIALHSL